MKINRLFLLTVISALLVLSQQSFSSQSTYQRYKDLINQYTNTSQETQIEEENAVPTNSLYREYPNVDNNSFRLNFYRESRLNDEGIDYLAGNSLSEYWVQEKKSPHQRRDFIISFIDCPLTNLENLFFSIGMMKNLHGFILNVPNNSHLQSLEGLRYIQYIRNLDTIILELQNIPIGDDQVENILSISRTFATFVYINGLRSTQISPSSINYIRDRLTREMPFAEVDVQ